VVLTVLTARVCLRTGYIVQKALVDNPAQPRRIQSIQVNASNYRPAAGADKLPYQLGRRFAPDRLDMLEASVLNSVLKPSANIDQMDIAENDSSKALQPQPSELRGQPRIHLGPSGANGSEVNPDGVCLCLNHVHASGVEANSTRESIVEVDQPCYLHARRGRALER
jgi:hypothetical protein